MEHEELFELIGELNTLIEADENDNGSYFILKTPGWEGLWGIEFPSMELWDENYIEGHDDRVGILNGLSSKLHEAMKALTIAKNAVEKAYGVSISSVKTLNYPIQRNTKFTKKGLVTGIKSGYKKAIVQLADGESIDFYNNL